MLGSMFEVSRTCKAEGLRVGWLGCSNFLRIHPNWAHISFELRSGGWGGGGGKGGAEQET